MDKTSHVFSIISAVVVILTSIVSSVLYLDGRLYQQDKGLFKIENEVDKIKTTFECFIEAVDTGVSPRICTKEGNYL